MLSTGPVAAHQAMLFRQLSDDVVVLAHTGPQSAPEQAAQLAALGIAVVAGRVTEVEAGPGGMTGVRLADGTLVGFDALVVAPVCRARAELLTPLGVGVREFLVGDTAMGTYVDAGPTGATSVPGLWVAANVADIQAQVVTSAAAGLAAGAAINGDLIAADAARAVQERTRA